MKKSHPIRRTLLATAATVSGIVLLLSLKPASDPAGSVQAGAAPSAQGGAGAAAGAQTLTGTAVQTDYGPVQVRITVNGGKITHVGTDPAECCARHLVRLESAGQTSGSWRPSARTRRSAVPGTWHRQDRPPACRPPAHPLPAPRTPALELSPSGAARRRTNR
ncbi:hypothetical protein [Streptomyces capitiformicae]|uniref:hypothetical protein n=1 Tax=Streptomyces capitiformicae TaxID=2014920 RepID=UPI001E56271F|nr:hypothetical protein [Streptomyces capitiformicae]